MKHSHKNKNESADERNLKQDLTSRSPWSSFFRQGQLNNRDYAFLCIITETNACDTDSMAIQTSKTLQKALGDYNEHGIDLISIRVTHPTSTTALEKEKFQKRLVHLACNVMYMKKKHQSHPKYHDYKVVINDVINLEAAVEADVDGIHVKEKDVDQIPFIKEHLRKEKMKKGNLEKIIIGTSAHSIVAGISNYENFEPDYMFVGTCYLTQSHPEKNQDDLEGPLLPARVKNEIRLAANNADRDEGKTPIIFAIGGIEKSNCHEPVSMGADGVAVIRSVMQAPDPKQSTMDIKSEMRNAVLNVGCNQ